MPLGTAQNPWPSRLSAARLLPWLLAGAGTCLALVTAAWIQLDSCIGPPTDSEHHLFFALMFSRALDLGGLPAFWDTLRNFFVGWPPATYALLYGPLAWAVSEQSQVVRLYGVALVPLLMWATYRLGTRLGDRATGALAAILVVFSLGLAGQIRQVSLDLPATAAVLLALLALAAARPLEQPRSALLLGAACGLCVMVRIQSLFFIGPPLLAVTITALARAPDGRGRRRRLLMLGLALLAALAVSSPYWAGRVGLILKVCVAHVGSLSHQPGRGDPGMVAGLIFYGSALGRLAGWPVLLAAAALFAPLVARGPGRRGSPARPGVGLLVSAVAGGVIGCSMGIHRESRYLLPALPALALLAALGVRSLPRRARAVVGVLLLASSVGPTLWLAGFPLRHGSRAAGAGLVDWAYVRRPGPAPVPAAVQGLVQAIHRTNDRRAGGDGAYLLLLFDRQASFLHRLGGNLARDLPGAVLSTVLYGPHLANSEWHRRQRLKRKLYVLTESDKMLEFEVIWFGPKKRYGNAHDLRLYEIPDGHSLHGRLKYNWLLFKAHRRR